MFYDANFVSNWYSNSRSGVLILEQLRDYWIVIDENKQWQIKNFGPLKQYFWDSATFSYIEIEPPFTENPPGTFEKLAGFCFQVLDFNQKQVETLYKVIKTRNNYVHTPRTKKMQNNKTQNITIEQLLNEQIITQAIVEKLDGCGYLGEVS